MSDKNTQMDNKALFKFGTSLGSELRNYFCTVKLIRKIEGTSAISYFWKSLKYSFVLFLIFWFFIVGKPYMKPVTEFMMNEVSFPEQIQSERQRTLAILAMYFSAILLSVVGLRALLYKIRIRFKYRFVLMRCYNNIEGEEFPLKMVVAPNKTTLNSFAFTEIKDVLSIKDGDICLGIFHKGNLLAAVKLKESGYMPLYCWANSLYLERGVSQLKPSMLQLAKEFSEKCDLAIQASEKDENLTLNANKTQANKPKKTKEEIQQVWQSVFLNKDTKSLLQELSLDFVEGKKNAVKGLLLFGPPGTGKSLIAKSMADTMDCEFISIKLHDLKGQTIGSSGQNVKDLWSRALSCDKAVIFIDECEGVFAKRGGTKSDQFSEDIVQAFLAEWEGFSKQDSVMVVGATNKVDLIDDAILSRFTEQLEISLPDKDTRREILISELRKLDFTGEVPEKAGEVLQGFSGRDIANVSKKLIRKIDKTLTLETLEEFSKTKRTGTNVSVSKNATWENLILREDKKNELIEATKLIQNAEKFRELDIVPKGMVLYGPPGTGKTQIARTMANESGMSFLTKSPAELKGQFIGAGAHALRQLFEDARAQSPCIVFIDEVENLVPDRTSATGNMAAFTKDVTNQLLTELDGVTEHTQEVFLLAATNHLDKIDSAMLSRFSSKIEIPLPKNKERFEMLKVFIKKTPINFSLDKLEEIADATEGKSGRDLSSMVKAALRKAALRHEKNLNELKLEFTDFGIQETAKI